MIKRPSLYLLISTLIIGGVYAIYPTVAWAATSAVNPQNAGQALEIAPPVNALTLNPGQTTTIQILIRDISSSNLIVTGTANDFVAAGEDGTPKILLNGEFSPYSMKDWVAPLPNLLLVPREIKAMTATIRVPKNASPGGHYAVIRFTATPPELKDTGVSLSASLGALLLVTVTGNIQESLNLPSFTVSRDDGLASTFFETGPLTFSQLFKNSGNVHEEPTGEIVLSDMLGHKIATLPVNAPPKNVLPQSARKFNELLDNTVIGNKFLFGRYTAVLTATYGTQSEHTLTGTISFWVIPYKLILAIVALIVAGFFVLRALIIRYNRYVITQAQKQRRR